MEIGYSSIYPSARSWCKCQSLGGTYAFIVKRLFGIDRVVKRAAAAELENAMNVSAHWLRHSHATHALDEGVPVHLVQATLGHTSLDTTSKYLHVSPDRSSGEVLVKRWSEPF
ncbi:MAG: site-specific integrase [Nostoc desertorum CM1-VF14]|jgi:integrase|nr:site-specific integrase [Nostoc desertorum CM1-VF14]